MKLNEALPCPFCGKDNIWLHETDDPKYVCAICNSCGAQSEWVRKFVYTLNEEQANRDAALEATEVWNKRIAPTDELTIIRTFWQRHTQSNVDRMSLDDMHAIPLLPEATQVALAGEFGYVPVEIQE